MRTIRNVFRRKLRVTLTISGITIGVLALVVMGGMAEKIGLLVSGGTEYYSDKVTVLADGGSLFFSGALLSYNKYDAIKSVPGVAGVWPPSMGLLDTETSMSFGMPPMFSGSDMRDAGTGELQPQLLRRPGAHSPTTTGRWCWAPTWSKRLGGGVGGTSPFAESSSQSSGLDKTLTAPDTTVSMTLARRTDALLAGHPRGSPWRDEPK